MVEREEEGDSQKSRVRNKRADPDRGGGNAAVLNVSPRRRKAGTGLNLLL